MVLNDEIRIAPANTICRFLASRFNLNGSNEIENIQCDMINEQLRECADYALKIVRESDIVKRHELQAKFLGELLPKTLNGYEKMLSLSSRFIVGSVLSWADLGMLLAWEWLDEASKQLIGRYPLVKSHNEFIRSLPKVSEWLREQKPLRVFKNC